MPSYFDLSYLASFNINLCHMSKLIDWFSLWLNHEKKNEFLQKNFISHTHISLFHMTNMRYYIKIFRFPTLQRMKPFYLVAIYLLIKTHEK